MPTLKNHPFAVETFFQHSLVLTYAVPKEELQGLIPECLTLDTFNDEWAFIAVAMVKTQALRPKGFPAFLGNDFVLTGFRVFVRYTTNAGKNLRGLYILKSETNKWWMSFLGNFFTHYNYGTTDIDFTKKNGRIHVVSTQSAIDIEVDTAANEVALPAQSPFANWKEARRFAGPLPFTFTYTPQTKQVLIIEGVRQNWVPRPVGVLNANVGFITQKGFKKVVPANAFLIENIPYYWKKGKTELWQGR